MFSFSTIFYTLSAIALAQAMPAVYPPKTSAPLGKTCDHPNRDTCLEFRAKCVELSPPNTPMAPMCNTKNECQCMEESVDFNICFDDAFCSFASNHCSLDRHMCMSKEQEQENPLPGPTCPGTGTGNGNGSY